MKGNSNKKLIAFRFIKEVIFLSYSFATERHSSECTITTMTTGPCQGFNTSIHHPSKLNTVIKDQHGNVLILFKKLLESHKYSGIVWGLSGAQGPHFHNRWFKCLDFHILEAYYHKVDLTTMTNKLKVQQHIWVMETSSTVPGE